MATLTCAIAYVAYTRCAMSHHAAYVYRVGTGGASLDLACARNLGRVSRGTEGIVVDHSSGAERARTWRAGS